MFRLLALLAVLASFAWAPVAIAAPTCPDNGTTTRCGTPHAMPVGWRLPPEEFNRRQALVQGEPTPHAFSNAVVFIVLLLSIIALLPDFDGRNDSDWDEQEGDGPRR